MPKDLIANKQLGKPALNDPVTLSRFFKRITNKTLKNIQPDKRLVITRPFRPGSESHTLISSTGYWRCPKPRSKPC
jgi:hypothetical protein